MTPRPVYKPCPAATSLHQPITNRTLNMGNFHLVCFAMTLMLTVVQFGEETVAATVTTTKATLPTPASAGTTTKVPSQTTASAGTTTKASGTTTAPTATQTQGNGSIKHGVSPLILMCGILAKLFLSA